MQIKVNTKFVIYQLVEDLLYLILESWRKSRHWKLIVYVFLHSLLRYGYSYNILSIFAAVIVLHQGLWE